MLLLLGLVAPIQNALASGDEGLFATFVTSHGNFTVLLEHEKTPATVANFVGLAEGTRPWLDTKKGRLERRPFYDGLTFHRVVPGFVIQAGSPNGLGTDGPGYEFGDEFHPALRHNTPGILSMANSGTDTNGSQFFVTLGPTEHLDNKHSVFGRVIEGMSAVYLIGSGESGATTIDRVEISRAGASALAFDAAGAHGVPEWTEAGMRWTPGRGLAIEREPFAGHWIWGSGDLGEWEDLAFFRDYAEAGPGVLNVSWFFENRAKYFFRAAKIQYARRPGDFLGRTVELRFTSGSQVLVMSFSADPEAATPGTFVLDQNPRADVLDKILEQEMASTRLSVALSGVGDLTFSLKFRSATEGWFTAQGYGAEDGYWPLYGTFSVRENGLEGE
jgi:peptidyl-prolyl cis-trans isomerase A (cyclophilin A)